MSRNGLSADLYERMGRLESEWHHFDQDEIKETISGLESSVHGLQVSMEQHHKIASARQDKIDGQVLEMSEKTSSQFMSVRESISSLVTQIKNLKESIMEIKSGGEVSREGQIANKVKIAELCQRIDEISRNVSKLESSNSSMHTKIDSFMLNSNKKSEEMLIEFRGLLVSLKREILPDSKDGLTPTKPSEDKELFELRLKNAMYSGGWKAAVVIGGILTTIIGYIISIIK